MLKAVKLTPRQTVLRYAAYHGLVVHGSEAKQDVLILDKQGHWSEAWNVSVATWDEAQAKIAQIEEDYWNTMTRPWNVARQTYTGTMKPSTA